MKYSNEVIFYSRYKYYWNIEWSIAIGTFEKKSEPRSLYKCLTHSRLLLGALQCGTWALMYITYTTHCVAFRERERRERERDEVEICILPMKMHLMGNCQILVHVRVLFFAVCSVYSS